MKDVWLLTEERPKSEVVQSLISKFMSDNSISGFFDTIRFIPVLGDNDRFEFTYEVLGISSEKINKVYIKTVSGKASFVDYLLFYQEEEPDDKSEPLYVIEETKTDDTESRNTGVYQRASKFVYAKTFYPNAKLIMLYSLRVQEADHLTLTNQFGMRCLLVLGVEVMGKMVRKEKLRSFESVDELIALKSKMPQPPAGNVPINIRKISDSEITVSGRLFKSDSLSHDPNIGALSLISATLRELGWSGAITITLHGLSQKHLKGANKFIRIANQLDVQLEGLTLPAPEPLKGYWHYETRGEKLGTIFIHLAVESFTSGYSIFENHAGCEKSYFQTKSGSYVALAKYKDRDKYKAGDKTQIIAIPDLVLVDFEKKTVVNAEGKKYEYMQNGIKELEAFDAVEDLYIKPSYKDFNIVRTVVLYGSDEKKVREVQVGFLLNQQGDMILGPNAPDLFVRAIDNLVNYWS